MKSVNSVRFLALALAFSFSIVGCKKSPKPITPIPSRGGQVPANNNMSPIRTGPQGDTGLPLTSTQDPSANSLPPTQGSELPDSREIEGNYVVDREMFSSQTVYFDYDSSAVKASELPKLRAVADFLKNESAHLLRIEGHCDERGTPEYNRALGERRALSVREGLIGLGIAGNRVSTISFGEDKPVDPGATEEAFFRNRRGEFILLTPKP